MPSIRDWDNEPGFDRDKAEFIRLNLEEWLAKHDIVKAGREQGRDNKPMESQQHLDATEEQIVAWIQRRGRVCRENVAGFLSDLERDLADMDNDEDLIALGNQVSEILRNGKFELQRQARQGEDDLATPRKELKTCNGDFNEFRRTSRLSRVADYSQRRKAWWTIFGFFGLEVILNASLLMEVNAFGLLGSSMQMGLISVANILIAGLAMGELLRQSNHVERWRKVCTWVAIGAVLCTVILFNIAIGHFRDSMQAIVNDPSADILALGNDVIGRLKADLAGFQSFQSLLLAVLGILFFAVASWKWLQRDDPYPDYGRRDRELKSKWHDYSKAYSTAMNKLSLVTEKPVSDLEGIRHSLTSKQTRWRETFRQGNRVAEEFPVQLDQYQDDLNYLLQKYREANLAARSDPAPSYFAARHDLDAKILASPAFRPPPQENIGDVMNRVAAAIKELQQLRRDAGLDYPNAEAVCASV